MIGNRFEKLRPAIRALEAIPTIPAIVQPLAEMLQQPADRVDISKVIELVSYDKTIAAQCLRMANSPLFGRRDIDTVRSAVIALGLKRVQAILMGCCVHQIVPANKWIVDPVTFWRHSLGCALVSRRMAKLIGHPDPEKAYLAGLLHDVGIIVNCIVVTDDFRHCIHTAYSGRVALDRSEAEQLGFTHCQTGKVLAECWHLPNEIAEVIEFHHDVKAAPSGNSLVSIVHLSDLLCRLRDLGYGYYEAMGIDLAGDLAWSTLVKHYPELASMDLARFTLEIDGAMGEIMDVVNSVFRASSAGEQH